METFTHNTEGSFISSGTQIIRERKMSNMSIETTTQIVRISEAQSQASSQFDENIGSRSHRVVTTASELAGRGGNGANVLNRNRATSNLDSASEYSEYQQRRVIDFDESSMGGESTQIVRQIGGFKGARVVNNNQNADDKEDYLYNDEDEIDSHNNYNYYKDNKEKEEENGSYRHGSSYK